ncbi:hypothetical protein [Pelomonas cellulosilytica]|uniref:NIPSNAP domain-containing protein n=1 Tax=Pelomonas cellulosilytica TaxID=2906762 RepID=A0ABS8XX39_9BURK|nr:hypothetical protein [Pelomonas sp. P8]MCE4557229.1 hypothetical protein [Pelomonas sp. P8]
MKRLTTICLALVLAGASTFGWAQDAKPYKEGPVTEVSYIKIKPGRFDDYMQFLATSYRGLMDAQKKAGLILGYNIYSAQAKTPQEPDLILTVTYANMAALDRIDEAEAVSAKVIGSQAAQNKATVERGPMRDILGSELIRELVLK